MVGAFVRVGMVRSNKSMTPKEIAVGVRDLIIEHGWWDGNKGTQNTPSECPITGACTFCKNNCNDRLAFYTHFEKVANCTIIPTWNDALDPATGQETVLRVLQEMIDG